MKVKDFLPFPVQERASKRAPILDIEDRKVLPKLFKAVGLAVGYTGGVYSVGFNRVNFEPSPYDFDRIIQAIDTDSYVKQGFNKYRELFWKEGWTIVGDNEEAIEYLRMRIQFMELSMQRSFNDLVVGISDQLIKFANGFVVKVRGDLDPHFPYPLESLKGKNPIVGYEILPAETVEIMRDYRNNPLKYRQNIWGAHGYNAPSGFGRGQRGYTNLLPTWSPDEMVHFVMDQKPGRLFGTPFIISVMDDVLALRQIEEDIQNLVHRELFPLYKYQVGTEDHPAEPDEIRDAADELANLRVEGGLVLPERHDVEVVGGEGKALDITPYLQHFKERVAVGIGLSQHHLGMSEEGGNRSVTERLDIALYDKVKLMQKYFADVIRLQIFDELLLEGGFDPYIPHSKISDACTFVFNEIDVDTQVKKENHIIQKYISDLITLPEARLELKHPPDIDEQDLYTAISNRLMPAPGSPVKPGSKGDGGSPSSSNPNKPAGLTRGGNNNLPQKPDAAKPSTGGVPNRPQGNRKATLNKSMPSNQHGRLISPNITHNELEYINELVELIDEKENEDE